MYIGNVGNSYLSQCPQDGSCKVMEVCVPLHKSHVIEDVITKICCTACEDEAHI